MRMSLFLWWALVGWCGTVLRYRIPPLGVPDPERPPRPNWLVPRIIGVVAGVIGGWAFVQVFGPHPEPWRAAGPQPEPWATGVFAAATAAGAFIAARIATDIYEQLSNRRG